MPTYKRHKTRYPGVFFIEGHSPLGRKPDRIFYIRYKRNGKTIEEKAGRASTDAMTAARAAQKRAQRMTGKEAPNTQKRQNERAKAKRWTVDRLWAEYQDTKPDLKGWATYRSLYKLHIKKDFGGKQPKDILPLDVKRVENRLLKTHSPQLTKHALKLLRAICNFGADNSLCPGLSFKMRLPKVNNAKTEDLTKNQLKRLLKAIEADPHPLAGNLMRLALCTGMRKMEMFRLEWGDIDFENGFIHIREPKGGTDQTIPLNDSARALLRGIRRGQSPYVFPGRNGEQLRDLRRPLNRIKKNAGLPADFRPLHGLRHVFASMLASSGQVDLYTLQKLLTHKDASMTQRYAHLRDEALKRASDVASDIIGKASGIGVD